MTTELVISIAPNMQLRIIGLWKFKWFCGVSPAKLRVVNIIELNSKNVMEYHGDKDYEPITLWVNPIFRQTHMLFLNIFEL